MTQNENSSITWTSVLTFLDEIPPDLTISSITKAFTLEPITFSVVTNPNFFDNPFNIAEWKMPDSKTGISITHAFTRPGNKTIVLEVSNGRDLKNLTHSILIEDVSLEIENFEEKQGCYFIRSGIEILFKATSNVEQLTWNFSGRLIYGTEAGLTFDEGNATLTINAHTNRTSQTKTISLNFCAQDTFQDTAISIAGQNYTINSSNNVQYTVFTSDVVINILNLPESYTGLVFPGDGSFLDLQPSISVHYSSPGVYTANVSGSNAVGNLNLTSTLFVFPEDSQIYIFDGGETTIFLNSESILVLGETYELCVLDGSPLVLGHSSLEAG